MITNCVTVGKLLNLPEYQFLQDKTRIYLIELLQD